MNVAIVLGISDYSKSPLPASKEDAIRMDRLLRATGAFEVVHCIMDDTTANAVKEKIRTIVRSYENGSVDTLFFYFSGHGLYEPSVNEFFMLCSDHNPSKKSVTSLPTQELDDCIRLLSPKLTVKVIDACNSGFRYIKSSPEVPQRTLPNNLSNVIIMSSSLDTQTSSAIADCSFFTQKFIEAVLFTNIGGEVLYRDIQSYIADEFDTMPRQTPYFVSQSSNLEVFAKHNTAMSDLKNEWYPEPAPQTADSADESDKQQVGEAQTQTPAPKPVDIISKIEASLALREVNYVEFAEVSAAIERVRANLFAHAINEPLAAHFYKLSVDLDRKLDVFKRNTGFVDIALEQKWQSKCFIEFLTKPTRVRERKSDLLTMMKSSIGQYSENDYENVIRDVPFEVKLKQDLALQVIWIDGIPKAKLSLPRFFAVAGIVNSRTHLIVSWAIGQQKLVSWNKFEIDWEEVTWQSTEILIKDFVANPDIIWKAEVGELATIIERYLSSCA